MDEIIFQTLTSTPTGVGASSGKNTEEAFNSNFAKVKTYIQALFNIASITVTSEQLTQIKVDTSVTPYALYYSLDPVDTPPGEVIWYDFDSVGFSDILGDPTDNIALATALADKASVTTVNNLSTTVTGLSSTVSNHTNAIAHNTEDIATNTSSISGIRSDMIHLVHSPTSDGTLYLRYNQTELRVEYSQDNSHWYNIASGAVTFADISGSPTDNNNLVSYVTNAIQAAINDLAVNFVSTTDFNLHVNNTNNPHQVTKAQVGLGNVDNTSDLDKPIPTAMQEEVDLLWARYPKSFVLGVTDYNNLPNVAVNQQEIKVPVAITNESISITSSGTSTCLYQNLQEGSITITDDFSSTYTDSDGNILDGDDNVVATVNYTTGVITSLGLEITSGTIDYTYLRSTVEAGDVFPIGHTLIHQNSVVLFDGSNTTYIDDGSGNIVDSELLSSVVATINYATGVITSSTLRTAGSGATVSYVYTDTNQPEDAMYYTSSNFNS